MKFIWMSLIISVSGASFACDVDESQKQYEQYVEARIAGLQKGIVKFKNMGGKDSSSTIVDLKNEIQTVKEESPISKYVDVEKYKQVYEICVAKSGKPAIPTVPCGSPYTIKECTHEAYVNSERK